MKRREFLTIPATALGGTLLYTLAREPLRLQAQEGNVNIPLRFFSAAEARIVAAACARIFPTDTTGPGANEAGVVIYIDRQLAGPTAATNIDTPKAQSWNRSPNTATRVRKHPAKSTAPASRH